MGWQRHGACDEVAATRGLHLAADPRRRGASERDATRNAARRTRLDAGLAKACETAGSRRMRREDFAGACGEQMYCLVMAIRREEEGGGILLSLPSNNRLDRNCGLKRSGPDLLGTWVEGVNRGRASRARSDR